MSDNVRVHLAGRSSESFWYDKEWELVAPFLVDVMLVWTRDGMSCAPEP